MDWTCYPHDGSWHFGSFVWSRQLVTVGERHMESEAVSKKASLESKTQSCY